MVTVKININFGSKVEIFMVSGENREVRKERNRERGM